MTASCDFLREKNDSNWRLVTVNESLPAEQNSETRVRLSREFHRRARRCSTSVGEHEFTCEWIFESTYAESFIALQSPDTALLIAVESRPSNITASERGWWEYNDATRWLAWGIEHDTLISLFQNLLGVTLNPTRSIVSPEEVASRLNLRWRFFSNNTRFEGTALLDATLLSCLITNNHWFDHVTNNLRWQIHCTLSVEIPMGEISALELASSASGDLLLIGNTQAVHDFVIMRLVSSDRYWLLASKDQHYLLCSASLKYPLRKTYMANEQYTPPSGIQDASLSQKSFFSIEQLPVQLALQLGEIEIPLGELEQLQPGYVIALPQSPHPITPTLLANGKAIGRGVLVTLGNQLGVRITEWKSNGL